MTDLKTDSDQLKAYMDAGWQLIPLHRHDTVDSPGGIARNRGKSPRDKNWTRKPYSNVDQVAHMEKGGNVGVRLRATDLVLDVDPRNFAEGDDPLDRLCKDCGINLGDYPSVETGSGGWHYYMRKPEDISTRDSLKEYEGLEYKTLGRQVVAAGSIHPTAKTTYVWDFLSPNLEDAPEAPERLINTIRRPVMTLAHGGEGGEYTQEKLAELLEELDVLDFADQSEWFTLMQACHHATCGSGRSEFIDWSTGDPAYSDAGGMIGLRWDSLHSGDDDDGSRVTYKTLNKLLVDAGKGDVIPQRDAKEDFPEDDRDDLNQSMMLEDHEKLSPMDMMNRKYYAVTNRGKFSIMWEELDEDSGDLENGVKPRKIWVNSSATDFKLSLGHKHVLTTNKKGEDVLVPRADHWLKWPKRRSVDRVVFSPDRNVKGALNLWTGWGHDPKKSGSWGRLEEMLFEVLSDGDQKVFDYIMDWAAYMVQQPGRPAEVAICFQGGMGIGKGTWGRTLASLAGNHGMQISSSDQLTGRFNDHLRNVILLFADEAISPYDKAGESRLKSLITEPLIAFEGKGEKVVTGKNHAHIVMASNDDWFVPLSMSGERRYMVQRANDKWQGQYSKFDKLNAELASGGYSRLMFDLIHRDISGWAPRLNIPNTEAAFEQKLRNLGPMAQWWFNILTSGEIPFKIQDGTAWGNAPAIIFKTDLRDDYSAHATRLKLRNPLGSGKGTNSVFARDLHKLVPDMVTGVAPVPDDRPDIGEGRVDGRANTFIIPALDFCRGKMCDMMNHKIEW